MCKILSINESGVVDAEMTPAEREVATALWVDKGSDERCPTMWGVEGLGWVECHLDVMHPGVCELV